MNAPPTTLCEARAAVADHADPPYALTLLGLAGAYAAYVAVGVDAWGPAALVALTTAALVAALRRHPADARAALSAGLLVLAAWHLRALHGGAPAPLVQLALGAAVATSAATTLAAHRLGPHRVRAVAPAVAAAVAALAALRFDAALTAALAAALGAAFAWTRPLGALAAFARAAGLHRGPRDPALTWEPLR